MKHEPEMKQNFPTIKSSRYVLAKAKRATSISKLKLRHIVMCLDNKSQCISSARLDALVAIAVVFGVSNHNQNIDNGNNQPHIFQARVYYILVNLCRPLTGTSPMVRLRTPRSS